MLLFASVLCEDPYTNARHKQRYHWWCAGPETIGAFGQKKPCRAQFSFLTCPCESVRGIKYFETVVPSCEGYHYVASLGFCRLLHRDTPQPSLNFWGSFFKTSSLWSKRLPDPPLDYILFMLLHPLNEASQRHAGPRPDPLQQNVYIKHNAKNQGDKGFKILHPSHEHVRDF